MTRIAFILLLVAFSITAQEKNNFAYLGPPFYPEQKLSVDDSLKWPLTLDINLDVKDIKNLEIDQNRFYASYVLSIFSEFPREFITSLGDTLDLSHSEFVQVYIESNDPSETDIQGPNYFTKKDGYDYLFYDDFYLKSISRVSSFFDINWDFSRYPFDHQELQFKFTSTVDSSIIRLNTSTHFPSTVNKNLPNLKHGYRLGDFSSQYEYNEDASDLILTKPGVIRPIVTETLVISLILERDSFWLFIKLFTGGLLSLLISLMVFMIPKKEFESRITLMVGAVFGAIGNRYFVDSILPDVQILTKADLINNLIIAGVVFNILVMLLQHSKYDHFPYFQNEKNALFYSSYAFLVLLGAILIW